MMRRILLLTLLALSSCSNAPLSVPIRDFDVDFAGIQTGQAVFTKASFNKPPVAVSQLALEGTLTFPQTSASFTFFASDAEPCNKQVSGIYVCNPNAPHIEELGTTSFATGKTQPLQLSGTRLKDGINSGNLWIGVRLDTGGIASGTLQFRNMVAKVALVP